MLPLRAGGKAPDGRLVPRGLLNASCDPRRVRPWWRAQPGANVGLRTGVAFDVVDIDDPAAWDLLEEVAGGPIKAGMAVITARGWHLYFAPAGLGCRTAILPGVDIRGTGGYVVAPPSLHPSGARYRFVDMATGEMASEALGELVWPRTGWWRFVAPR